MTPQANVEDHNTIIKWGKYEVAKSSTNVHCTQRLDYLFTSRFQPTSPLLLVKAGGFFSLALPAGGFPKIPLAITSYKRPKTS